MRHLLPTLLEIVQFRGFVGNVGLRFQTGGVLACRILLNESVGVTEDRSDCFGQPNGANPPSHPHRAGR
jgi:hypothetical protein